MSNNHHISSLCACIFQATVIALLLSKCVVASFPLQRISRVRCQQPALTQDIAHSRQLVRHRGTQPTRDRASVFVRQRDSRIPFTSTWNSDMARSAFPRRKSLSACGKCPYLTRPQSAGTRNVTGHMEPATSRLCFQRLPDTPTFRRQIALRDLESFFAQEETSSTGDSPQHWQSQWHPS
jgi:hypothetical protein